MEKKINYKLILKILALLALILLFFYLFFSEDGLMDLLKNPDRIKKNWLIMAIICQLINLFIDAFLIYRFTVNIEPSYKLKGAIKSSFIGQFYSAITPGASGGQPMQVYTMASQNVDPGHSTSALMQKFLVYQTVLTAYSAVCILVRIDYFNNLNKIVWSISLFGFIVQALVIASLLFFSFNKVITTKILSGIFYILEKLKILKNSKSRLEKLNEQLEMFHKGNKELYKNSALVLETYVLTIIQLTAIFLIPYCIYRSFDFSGKMIFDMISAQAFVTMASSFVPIPGASGATEGASSIFYMPFFGSETIKAAILLTRIVSYYFTIVVSAPFAKIVKKKKL